MTNAEIEPWIGQAGRVKFNTSQPGELRVYVVLEGRISRVDATTISVTPIPRLGITTARYPGNGHVAIAEIESIEL
jgi:hypothetical protein